MSSTILGRLLVRDIDHPAPEHCPCGTILISSLIYAFEGEIHESKYCASCDVHVPEPKANWTKWKPTKDDFFTEDQEEELKKSRKRYLSGQRW